MHQSLILCFVCIDACLMLVAISQSRYIQYCFPYTRPPTRLSPCRRRRRLRRQSNATPHDVADPELHSATLARESEGAAGVVTATLTLSGTRMGFTPSVIGVVGCSWSQIQSQTHHRRYCHHQISGAGANKLHRSRCDINRFMHCMCMYSIYPSPCLCGPHVVASVVLFTSATNWTAMSATLRDIYMHQ